jgi:hypothetical protein
MAQRRQLFDDILSVDAVAGSNDLESERVESGWEWCVQHLAVENETSNFTDFRVLKERAGSEYLLEEQDSPLADVLYWSGEEYYLSDGQRLVVRFTGCTAGDRLRVYLSGWRRERERRVS